MLNDDNSFVAEHRKDLTLKNLESELEAYVANLDNTLVSIINNDYSAFLKLSSMLVDIDSLVAGLREPLTMLEHKVQDARKVVSDPLEKQQALLERLIYVREKRKLIQLCLSAWETLEKVETQVEQLRTAEDDTERGSSVAADRMTRATDAGDSVSSPDRSSDATPTPIKELRRSESNGEALGRATQRLARVTFLAQENSGLPLLRMIRAKARSLEHSLIEQLEYAFVQAVSSGSGGSGAGTIGLEESSSSPSFDAAHVRQIAVVFRAYTAINHTQEAMEVFKRRVVEPSLRRVLTQGRLDAGGARGAASGLQSAYGDVLRFLQTTCRPMLAAIHDPNEGLGEIDLIGTSVVQGLAEVIKEQMSQVYSSGNPDVLHDTYLKTEAFFGILRSFAPHPEKVDRTADHVLGMWNLSVYVQLRSQEMSRKLEESLSARVGSDGKLAAAPSGPGSYRLRPSAVVVECFQECWSDKVFLAGVAARIFKLVLQLSYDYLAWSEASIKYVSSENGVTLPKLELEDDDLEELEEAAQAKTESVSGAWAGTQCEQLILLSADNAEIAGFLESQVNLVKTKVSGRAVGTPQGNAVGEAVQKALQETLCASLKQTSLRARYVVEQNILSACSETVLAGMKAVTPMYRMTNKPPPSQPCEYASKVLEPLEQFLASGVAQLLPDATTSAAKVLQSILEIFDEQSSRALEEITTSENALRRLNRNTGKRQLDSTKIRSQFFMDLERIVKSAEDAGVVLGTVPGYRELYDKLASTSS